MHKVIYIGIDSTNGTNFTVPSCLHSCAQIWLSFFHYTHWRDYKIFQPVFPKCSANHTVHYQCLYDAAILFSFISLHFPYHHNLSSFRFFNQALYSSFRRREGQSEAFCVHLSFTFTPRSVSVDFSAMWE